ncbi:MAG: hypothetical protein ABGY10_04540 [bacterium]
MTAKTHLYTFQLIWTEYRSVNTAEYGFGDYPKITEHELATVQAETLMKAQNKFKRMFPERNIIFRVNSPMMAYRVNRIVEGQK